VEGIFSDKKDPWKHISDAFGDFAKKMAADLVALTIKLIVFRTVLSFLAPGSSFLGGFGFSSVGGSGMGNALLGLLGGTMEKHASGTNQVVTKPTSFIAGESGAERVTITPRAKMSAGGSGGGITVNIQGDVMDGAKFTEAVEMAQKRLRRRSV
jgi:hypothetical protein